MLAAPLRPLILLALALGCTREPSAPDVEVASPPPAAVEPAPEPPPVTPEPEPEERRPPVSQPSEPALHSFTGQATHLGSGLWCAFYPLGWSDDGRFAWVEERRVNDMALEYGVVWHVRHIGSDTAERTLDVGTYDFDEDPTLAWAWEQKRAEVQALLTEETILAGGTDLQALPASTPMGTLSARWELGPVEEFQRSSELFIRWDEGPEQSIFASKISDLAPEPEAPRLLLAPGGAYAVLVIPVTRGEPVEALVDVQYVVHGLVLGSPG
jgi:hypothetical protein